MFNVLALIFVPYCLPHVAISTELAAVASGRIQNTVDFMADRVFFAHTVMKEVDMLTIRLAREKVHSDRDCVDDQLYFAQDVRQDMIVLSAKVVRERVHITVDIMIDQVLFIQDVMGVIGSGPWTS